MLGLAREGQHSLEGRRRGTLTSLPRYFISSLFRARRAALSNVLGFCCATKLQTPGREVQAE